MLTLKHLFCTILFICLCSWISACSSGEKKTSVETSRTTPSLIDNNQTGKFQPSRKNTTASARYFHSISPTEAFQMLKTRDDILFIDVRTRGERSKRVIPDSQHVPLNSIFKGTSNLPKDKAILLVCSVGGRSYTAGKILSSRGQHEVYNLSGGINAWYKAGLPILTDPPR